MGATKIDNLHNTLITDNDVVELQVPMREAHTMQVGDTIEDLQEAASNLLPRHPASHDNGKEVKGRILHDFEPAALFLQDVQGLNDVAVVESGSNAELGRHLFVVLPFRLIRVSGPEFLDGEDGAVLGSTHEPDGAASTRSQYLAESSVLGGQSMVVAKGQLLARAAGLTGFRR